MDGRMYSPKGGVWGEENPPRMIKGSGGASISYPSGVRSGAPAANDFECEVKKNDAMVALEMQCSSKQPVFFNFNVFN